MQKLRVYMPLKNGLGKKISAMRTAVTGDWKGIPPHVTLFDFNFTRSCFDDVDHFKQTILECAQAFVGKTQFVLCQEPNDIHIFKNFVALRYDVSNFQELFDEIKKIILEHCNIKGEPTVTETSDEIITNVCNVPVCSFPIYTKNPELFKGHISISRVEKIKEIDNAPQIIRNSITQQLKILTIDTFTEVKVDIVDNV